MSDTIDKSILTEATNKMEGKIPDGYMTIKMSTKGRVGAPAEFHIKDLTVEDLVGLSLADNEDVQIKTIAKLQSLILEDDVDIKKFSEGEVVETCIKLYGHFYSSVIRGLPYTVKDDDLKAMAKRWGGEDSEDYKSLLRDLANGKWKPTYDIDINSLDYYDIPENFEKNIRVSKKGSDFYCVYSYPRYGDVVILRDYINKIYKEKDKRYARNLETWKYAQDCEQRIRNGENVSYQSIPRLPESELKELKAYQEEKTIFTMKCLRALRLVNFCGKDVEDFPLDEKLKLIEDPRCDYAVFKKVEEYFEKQFKVGVKDTVRIFNPIKECVENTTQTFRVYDILSAIRDQDSDEYDITPES